MTKTRDSQRLALEKIAMAIKQLGEHLENREAQGERLTACEIDAMATKLQVFVEELVAASKSLRKDKSAE